ncbi:uncharacterized protein LOC129925800 [Biomphalaria glabrata]|uniref:Uncharacterized protein LOC129925800 n=1 Tax=Biomphalaria glabrata TaxID=6526 RepID=A0A9W3A5C5_BIOGL|nr:uncharacterized protein LOC129925800 [Biomphalaria glabrata]
MDRFLRPERLVVDPNDPDAQRIWKHWLHTFEKFALKLAVSEGEKFDLLCNFISHAVYELISDCTDFESAVNTLNGLYVKQTIEVYARYLLSNCKQETGQSVDRYIQRLRLLAKDCHFRAVTALENQNEAIRDAFISGMSSPEIRQRLLEYSSLDLAKSLEVARSLEMAQKHSVTYNSPQATTFQAQQSTTSELSLCSAVEDTIDSTTGTIAAAQGKCYFCGGAIHSRSKCPAKDATCNKCGKKGHYKKVCKSKLSTVYRHNSDSAAYTITAASSFSLSRAVMKIQVNNITLDALIDTGSSESYISASAVRKYRFKTFHSSKHISMANTNLTGYTRGHVNADIKSKGSSYKDFKLHILDNLCEDVILGHDFLEQHESVHITFQGPKPTMVLNGMKAANVEPAPLFQNMLKECRPIATKSRRYSANETLFINSEVERLLKDGVIEPSSSPWRAQVLITANERHKRRMVVDYSQTLNRFTLRDAYPLPRIDDMVSQIAKYEIFSTLDLRNAYHQIPVRKTDRPYTAIEAGGKLYLFCRIPFGVTNGVACFQRTIDKIIEQE